MTLRKRTLLFSSLTLIALLVAIYFVSVVVVQRGFAGVEADHVRADIERVRQALNQGSISLSAFNRDYSVWDETYAFALEPDDDYQEMIDYETLSNLKADIFAVLDRDGELILSTVVDAVQGETSEAPEELRSFLVDGSPLIPPLGQDRIGLLSVGGTPLLFASRPILHNDGSGPPAGTLVIGRYLDDDTIAALSDLTKLDLQLYLLSPHAVAPLVMAVIPKIIDSPNGTDIHVFDRNAIGGFLLLRDVNDQPLAMFGAIEPRPIYAQGQASIRYLVLGLLLLGVAIGATTIGLLERLVLCRVDRLSREVNAIGESGSAEQRVSVEGKDELAKLAENINVMLEKLETAQNQFREAKEEAIAANEAKSRFLANMSHEIRTPLNAVMGMTGLLRESELTPDQREYVETIYQGSESLLTIISDILDFSKIESGKLEMEQQPLNLRTAIELTLDIMAPRAKEKGLELVYRMNPDVPEVIRGDSVRLRQILLNLLSNAIKFTDTGEVLVTVHTGGRVPTDHAGLLLHFTVIDTGIGIPPDRINRLFRSFSQVDASTTRKYGGTGLGLAISRRLAELMGGEMWVESSGVPGDGAAFHFTICTEQAEFPTPEYIATQQPYLAGKRVLIVDDNGTNRRTLLRQVQQWGMTGLTTGSPLEALDWLRQGEHFDVALLDMQMDELDGKDLTVAIRDVEAQRVAETLPVVILSSIAARDMDAQALSVFVTLSKPIKIGALYDALLRIFGAAGAPPSETRPAAPRETLAENYPLRILLTEDNLVNRKLALRLLQRLGYEADVADDGRQAVSMVRVTAYDVVLMDVQMPVLDGLEATRRIRTELPPDDQPYIIAMTANAMAGDREACLAAGMNGYVSKPVQLAELDDAIEAAALARRGIPSATL